MEKNETCEIIQPELSTPTNDSDDDSDDSDGDDSDDLSYDRDMNNNKNSTKNSIFGNIMDAGDLVSSDTYESDEKNTIYETEKTNGFHVNDKV